MKVGEVFIHKHFIDMDLKPITCRITAIRKGYIYYQTVTGSKWKMTVVKFEAEYSQ